MLEKRAILRRDEQVLVRRASLLHIYILPRAGGHNAPGRGAPRGFSILASACQSTENMGKRTRDVHEAKETSLGLRPLSSDASLVMARPATRTAPRFGCPESIYSLLLRISLA